LVWRTTVTPCSCRQVLLTVLEFTWVCYWNTTNDTPCLGTIFIHLFTAPNSSTSSGYSRSQQGWPKSMFSKGNSPHMQCLALCEVINAGYTAKPHYVCALVHSKTRSHSSDCVLFKRLCLRKITWWLATFSSMLAAAFHLWMPINSRTWRVRL
jgi:hypothetical protein